MEKKQDFYEKLENRYYNIYSTGGEIERSYKKRTGDIINVDYDKYNKGIKAVDEIFKKIFENYYL